MRTKYKCHIDINEKRGPFLTREYNQWSQEASAAIGLAAGKEAKTLKKGKAERGMLSRKNLFKLRKTRSTQR